MKPNTVEIKKDLRRISRNGFGKVWVVYIDGVDTEEFSRKWEAYEAKELIDSGKISAEDWNRVCLTDVIDRYKYKNGHAEDSRGRWVKK